MANVRLVAITRPVIPECEQTGDLIAYCARVSNPDNQANTLTAPKLLSYLVRNAHWSPFEMSSMTIEIVTTRVIARQILRHRSFSFQEFSQRYAEVEEAPIFSEARTQDAKNRQASHETDDEHLRRWWKETQEDVDSASRSAYRRAIQKGIAKELARNLLPEGLTASRLYMAGTIRSFIHYVAERKKLGTQKEHREIAPQVRAILIEQFPALTEVLNG